MAVTTGACTMIANVYYGVVVSAQGPNPGPASGITYTVDINLDDGTVRRVSGVRPRNKRLPDVIHTIAAEPGDAVEVYDVGGNLRCIIGEGFDYDESCQ